MSDKVRIAQEALARVPFPQMHLGSDGTIWTDDGMKVATMNLRDLTLSQAYVFALAFVASGEALKPTPTAEGGAHD